MEEDSRDEHVSFDNRFVYSYTSFAPVLWLMCEICLLSSLG